MAELIHYKVVEEHVAILQLNRPDKMNALSSALLNDCHQHLSDIEKNNNLRAVIITGSGEKAFCAGADLKERRSMNEQETMEAVQQIGDMISRVENLPIPVIAAMNGVAFGGGLELALACDIRLCAANAKLGLTETSLAIIPGAGGTQRLTRLIGTGQAKKLIFTAKSISAEEAYRLGIVEEITKNDDAVKEAMDMAKTIAQNGPIAIRQAKQAINHGIETDIHTALAIEHTYYNHTIPTMDRQEGLRAFQERRKPVYTGR